MMKSKTRWGILSTAAITEQLIPAIKSHKQSELVAIASRNFSKAEETARQWKISRSYGSYQALLDDPEVDIVYIPLPNHLHLEWTLKAARAGKHVLVEKPIALSVDEVDQMAAAARENHIIIQEAFMYRFNPQTARVNQLMSEGVLGDLRFMRSGFQHIHNRTDDYRLKPEFGGGVLWDMGCYPVNFFQMITGTSPISVTAHKQTGQTGIDRSFFATMHFLKNVTSQFATSFDLPSYANVELHGTEGILFVSSPFKQRGPTGIILKRGKGFQNFSFNTKDPYIAEVENMVQTANGEAEVVISLLDSRKTVSTIHMLHEAAENA